MYVAGVHPILRLHRGTCNHQFVPTANENEEDTTQHKQGVVEWLECL